MLFKQTCLWIFNLRIVDGGTSHFIISVSEFDQSVES